MPINLINDIDNLNVDYLILNATLINNQEFLEVLDKFLKNKKDDQNHYKGFLDRKTVYKVEDYE